MQALAGEQQAVVRSLTHIAPEQILAPEEVDARTDLYAAGAVLYRLLAGVPPFEAGTFTISFDDITGTLFWKPGGVETVPTQIFAMLRNSISPEINALGTVMIFLTAGLPLVGIAIARRLALKRGG